MSHIAFNVTEIIAQEHQIEETPELNKVINLIRSVGLCDNPRALLPSTPWHSLQFTLRGTNSGFANAVRRTLVSELLVDCLDYDRTLFLTNDAFLLEDYLHKRINLIPIRQGLTGETKVILRLNKVNRTNATVSILASDLSVIEPADGKIDDIIPDAYFEIGRLRASQSVVIDKITLNQGYGMDDAGRYSLLANVYYKPIEVNPFDQFTKKGERSVKVALTSFNLAFTTTSNVSLHHVVGLLRATLCDKLEHAKSVIEAYEAADRIEPKDLREVDGLRVTISEDIYTYAFLGEYVTLAYMLVAACFAIDPNTAFVAPSVDRYDTRVGIVRIKHPNATKLLLEACDVCLRNVTTLCDALIAGLP